MAENRAVWDDLAEGFAVTGRERWAGDPVWGIWNIPESDVSLLPDLTDKDVLELGCGTAYISAWMARRGARVVGLDNSAKQLATARTLQNEHDLPFPLIHGDAELVPLADASFDFVISEYGAAIWCDPYRWIPEAARLLRPGGELMFLANGTILMLCVKELLEEGAADPTLLRRYFGMHRFEWSDSEGIEFHLGYGDWIRLFRSNGFIVEDLIELRPGESATTTYDFVDLEWARKWPSEQVWKLRKLLA